MLVCWTEGAAGLRRMPRTQTSGAALVAKASEAPPQGLHPSGLIQPSTGELPHCSARVPAGIALLSFGSVVCQSHSEANRTLRPRLPSSTTFIPNPIPSADTRKQRDVAGA